MKFLIDPMLPPSVVERLGELGHHAVTPSTLGAHNLPDEVLVQLATSEGCVIVTENASDFASVTDCPVLFVLKAWWPTSSLAGNLAAALDRWAAANPEPGPWSHWLPADIQ